MDRIARLRNPRVRRRVRDAAATELLGQPWSFAVILGYSLVMLAIAVAYYHPTADTVPVVLWPLYADSAVAVALATLALLSIAPTVFRGEARTTVSTVPTNPPLAYLHTLAFVWLMQFGLWPLIALNLAFDAYVAAPDAWLYYWGVIGTHLAFVGLALVLPAIGRTTPGALALATALVSLNAVVDYGFGYHPPLLYDPGPGLAIATLALGLFAVWLASRSFRPLNRS